MNEDIRRALTVTIGDSFPLISILNKGDWFSIHQESGQTVKRFEQLRKTRGSPRCNIIIIQSFGNFTSPRSPNVIIINEFSYIFFPGRQTEILPSVDFDSKIKKLINQYTNQSQYFVPRIGICAFARFDPLFSHTSIETLEKPSTQQESLLILKRAISTYLHDIIHLFGLEHYIYYLCLMNGANCEDEMNGQLIYLCPICLQ
ncbi:unnamed protein product [Rotaria sp. Silwood1]|nr:unnamed protein product [Rotaria sp. Silwood1]